MATNYWQLNSQSLGQYYLTDTELLAVLIAEEQLSPTPYRDTKGIASIGIGINITMPQHMALVLQMLGAINANQTTIQQQTIVAQFEAVVKSSTDNASLQNNLNLLLQFYVGPTAKFQLTTQQAKDLVTPLVDGFAIAAADGTSYSGADKNGNNGFQPA